MKPLARLAYAAALIVAVLIMLDLALAIGRRYREAFSPDPPPTRSDRP